MPSIHEIVIQMQYKALLFNNLESNTCTYMAKVKMPSNGMLAAKIY